MQLPLDTLQYILKSIKAVHRPYLCGWILLANQCKIGIRLLIRKHLQMRHVDTLAKYEEFIAAGFTEPQARAQARILAEAVEIDLDVIATKADLSAFATKADLSEFATKSDLHQLKVEMSADIRTLRSDMSVELKLAVSNIDARFEKIDHMFRYVYAFGTLITAGVLLPIIERYHPK